MKPSNLISKLGKDNSDDTNKTLENIRKNGGNKSCFDCGEKGVTYVVPKYGIFICSRCSGIHREIGSKVKGLGVSNFSEKEISLLQDIGNDNAHEIWMAKFNSSKDKLPKVNDENSIKEHLKLKYIEKKWYQSKSSEEIKESKINKAKSSEIFEDEDDESIKPETLKKKVSITSGLTSIPSRLTKEKKHSKDFVIVKNEPPKQLKRLDVSGKGFSGDQQSPIDSSSNSKTIQHPQSIEQKSNDPFDFSEIGTVQAVNKPKKQLSVNQQSHSNANFGNELLGIDFSKNDNVSEPFDFNSQIKSTHPSNEPLVQEKTVNEAPSSNNQGKKSIDDVFKLLDQLNTQTHEPQPQPLQFPSQLRSGFNPQINHIMMNPTLLMQNPQFMIMFQQMLRSQGFISGTAPGYPSQIPPYAVPKGYPNSQNLDPLKNNLYPKQQNYVPADLFEQNAQSHNSGIASQNPQQDDKKVSP